MSTFDVGKRKLGRPRKPRRPVGRPSTQSKIIYNYEEEFAKDPFVAGFLLINQPPKEESFKDVCRSIAKGYVESRKAAEAEKELSPEVQRLVASLAKLREQEEKMEGPVKRQTSSRKQSMRAFCKDLAKGYVENWKAVKEKEGLSVSPEVERTGANIADHEQEGTLSGTITAASPSS
ncbi:hypothetical protein HDU76_004813 [Blyttiomyces sp. JEL0837]|nr:hypothetical protein HDU76_004813 [Blyttiomyces sp. JEL0837]